MSDKKVTRTKKRYDVAFKWSTPPAVAQFIHRGIIHQATSQRREEATTHKCFSGREAHMLRIALVITVVLSFSPVFGQSLQSKIDSLKVIRNQLRSDLSKVETQIRKLKVQVEKERLEKMRANGIAIKAKLTAKIKDSPSALGKQIAVIPANTSVTVVDWKAG